MLAAEPYIQKNEVCGECLSWNPLIDNGDAFCLAVKLKAEIYHRNEDCLVLVGNRTTIYPHGNDACLATRIAIVMAAAEIGKTM